MDKPVGKPENYMVISRIIFISFFLSCIAIIIQNLNSVDNWLDSYFGLIKSEILKQFFYGTIGATISCSIFFNHDKETNEIESIKGKPNYEILRYPTKEDVHLYVQRIISGGVFAIVGVLVLLAGFGYLDIDMDKLNNKHKILFALSSILIGLFQSKFYDHLISIFDKIFKKNKVSEDNK